MKAVVTSLGSRSVLVHADGLGEIRCSLRGHLWEKSEEETRPLAVGDRVSLSPDLTHGEDQCLEGVIEDVAPRRNRIARAPAGSRGAPGKRDPTKRGPGGGSAGRRPDQESSGRSRHTAAGKVQVIAANIDQILVVAALHSPPFRPGLVDRFLVAAAAEEIDVLLILNKVDLANHDDERSVVEPFQQAGYSVIQTSTVTGEGIEELTAAMASGIHLLVGHSGTGKSSLLNAVAPTLNLTTSEVTAHHGRGRHTTTHVGLLPLPAGGWVIDSPGIREWVLEGVSPALLARLYPGFGEIPHECHYGDCLHRDEPQCALRQAVEEGLYPEDRYACYLRVLADLQGS